ncbi:MAG: hypothetical protein P1U85_14640, partial [Verrucomicrobiales bacterium]|nr:hypothetical protein [Verrucomicrobiales bacterium]
MKYRIPLLLTSLLLPLTLSSQELGVSVPENLDTSKPAAQLGYDLKIGTQFDTDMKVAQTMEMMGQKIAYDSADENTDPS